MFALIATLGDGSGAHLNPAVGLAFRLARRYPGREVIPYILAQCGGALAASLAVRLLVPDTTGLALLRTAAASGRRVPRPAVPDHPWRLPP